MSKRLQILHLEDEPDFAELVCTLLDDDQLLADGRQVCAAMGITQVVRGV